MNFTEYLRELTFPVRNLGTAVALVSFYLFLQLSAAAGVLGIWLLVMVLPALFRYLVLLAQARARGVEADHIIDQLIEATPTEEGAILADGQLRKILRS